MRFLRALIILFLLGCAPVQEQLRELISHQRYVEAIEDGEGWLGIRSNTEDATMARRIRELVAEARLRVAQGTNTVLAFRAYRQWAQQNGPFPAFQSEAKAGEATAFYTRKTLPANTVESFQEFRRFYPEATEVAEARRREAAVALQATLRQANVSSYQAWRARYEAWPEASESTSRAREAEARLALVVAIRANTSNALKDFRETYQGWDEGEAHLAEGKRREITLAFEEADSARTSVAMKAYADTYASWPDAAAWVARARTLAAERGFAEMRADGSLRAALDFEERFGEGEWRARARSAVAQLLAAPLVNALNNRRPLTDLVLAQVLEHASDRPELSDALRSHHRAIWAALRQLNSVSGYRFYRAVFPSGSKHTEAYTRETDAAWAHAEAAATPTKWLRFVEDYPQDSRHLEAERRYAALERLRQARSEWPRATISVSRPLSGGIQELYVDVRDCRGELMSGLKRRVFDVYFGDQKGTILDFGALEDERPVDLVFLVDLSGSMAVERAAVESAITGFVEELRFRGRNARVGLISYGTVIETKHSPVSSTRRFRRWMAELPDEAGGMAEDSVGALKQAATMSLRRNAERVAVLITDEELQLGLRGAGITLEQCQTTRRVRPNCNHCGTNVRCWARCGGQPSRTVSRRPDRRCQRIGALAEGSREMNSLARTLNTRRMRLYMLVPDSRTGQALGGFDALASQTAGRVLLVPQDSHHQQPYEAQLSVISEQLSKQYWFRVRAPAHLRNQSGIEPIITVRPMHLWRRMAQLPSGQLVGLFPRGGTPACPQLLYLTRDGRAYETENCAQGWREITLPRGRQAIRSAESTDEFVWALHENGDVTQFHGKPSEAQTVAEDVIAMAVQPEHGPWFVTQKGGLLQVAAAPGTHEDAVAYTLPEAPQALLGTSEGVCLFMSPTQRMCVSATEENPVMEAVEGLDEEQLGPNAQTLQIKSRKNVFLMAVHSGAVYRSLNGGSRWHRVLEGGNARPQLAMVEGVRSVVCATTHEKTSCSEDGGTTFRMVGELSSAETPSALATDGHQVYLAHGGELHRMDRIANRDIPSSSVYFSSGSDNPSPAMRGFLNKLSTTLREFPELRLRIEGHTDRRGSETYNQALSQRRANGVASFVRNAGIAEDRLDVFYFGEERPVRNGSSSSDLARNRRVELVLYREAPKEGWGSDPCAEEASLTPTERHKDESAASTQGVPSPPANATRTASGLITAVLRSGPGRHHPTRQGVVQAHILARMESGVVVLDSRAKGQLLNIVLNDSVPPGLLEGILMMVEGERRRFWMSPALVQGPSSSNGRESLVVDVELVSIQR